MREHCDFCFASLASQANFPSQYIQLKRQPANAEKVNSQIYLYANCKLHLLYMLVGRLQYISDHYLVQTAEAAARISWHVCH